MENKTLTSLVAVWILALAAPVAPAAEATSKAVTAYKAAHEQAFVDRFRDFLQLRNVAADRADMDRNANWIVERLRAAGFETEIWDAGGAPYVFAERSFEGATRTVLLYAHFDGQPVEPANWASPPWEPTLRSGRVEDGAPALPWSGPYDPDWRIYARSAGDDKAPVVVLLAALEALEAAGIPPSVNIKLILDGEEEAGSPTLADVLDAHGEQLRADLMLFGDGPMHQSSRRQLVFGVRGGMSLDLTTYGATRPLHSGHYGNWVPNPNDTLIRLLASMKDEHGRIVIPGYLDQVRPMTDTETNAIANIPSIEEDLRHDLALGRVEGGGERLEALVLQPAIIIKGFQGGGVGGQSRNVIQPSATASLNLRLVPDQQPARIIETMEAFLAERGFLVVHGDPDPETLRKHEKVIKADWRAGAYPGFRTSMDTPEARRLITILDAIDGQQTLLTPTMGGSLPIYLFEDAVQAPIIVLPIANHDNNQHGRNENIRIGNLWDAVVIYATVLSEYGRAQ